MTVRLPELIAKAAAEIGYTEDPPESNRTKYALTAIEVAQPWCGAFVDWCFAGTDLLPGSMFYTPSGANAFRSADRWSAIPAPGAVIFMTFRDDGVISHVGIVEKVNAKSVQTIEGNTSSGAAGSQDNGGGVARRTRSGKCIVGYGLVTYENAEDYMLGQLVRPFGFKDVFCIGLGAPFHVPSAKGAQELVDKGLVRGTQGRPFNEATIVLRDLTTFSAMTGFDPATGTRSRDRPSG